VNFKLNARRDKIANFHVFHPKQGDEFALRGGGLLYCKEDHDVLEKTTQTNLNTIEHNNNNAMLNNNNTISKSHTTSLSNNNHSSELGSMSGERKSSKIQASKFFQNLNSKAQSRKKLQTNFVTFRSR
jgi:hypothetical protein